MVDKSPAFQFYCREYLCDLAVRAMTYEQRGLYIELLALCWLERGIPADLDVLARVLAVDLAHLTTVAGPVLACFYSDGTRFQHKRLDKERAKQEAHRAERSTSGKAGAAKRWAGDGSAIVQPIAPHGSASAIASATAVASPAKMAFKGQRFKVWTWQHDDLVRALGSRPFDLLGWYPKLDAEMAKSGEPIADEVKWLRDRLFAAVGIKPNLFGKGPVERSPSVPDAEESARRREALRA